MTTWNDGYVFDIVYSGSVNRQQMPAHLDAACLSVGVEPPVQAGAPFSYCELGCGVGDTAMVVAAANAHARVWGFDFNPAHVAQARAVAARAGLDNVAFAERSFEELVLAPPDDLPPFDYVTLHGVWSWISPANQAHIVSFLRRHLRPGGLVCISYNALPGWTGTISLQRLLYEAGRCAGGSSDRRIREALALARRIEDLGSALDAAALKRVEGMLARGHVPYLSHEYLNEHWHPAFFAEVAGALTPAKLSYVASANILENFPQLCVKAEQRALVETLPPELRQTVLDYFCPRSFRRDIYVRGPRALPERARADRLGAQRLLLAVPSASATREIEIPLGKATLNEAFYGPVLATLGRGMASVGELAAAAAPGTVPASEEIIGMLVGSSQVLPAAAREPDAAAIARARRFNRAYLEICAEQGQQHGWLAGARVGAAVSVSLLEMLVYETVAATADPSGSIPPADSVAADLRALLAARKMTLQAEAQDRTLDIDDEVRRILSDVVPVWQRIGAL